MKKFTVNKSQLIIALSYLGHAIEVRSVMPVCLCVMCDVKKDRIIFTTTNTEITIVHEVMQENEFAFKVLIPFIELKKIASVCSEEIAIDKLNNKIVISSSKDRFEIVTQDEVEDFPVMPKVIFKNAISMPKEFSGVLAKSLFSVIDENKVGQACENVNIEIENSKLTITATDKIILFSKSMPLDYKGENLTALINPKAIGLLKELSDIELCLTDNFIFFNSENTTIIITKSEYIYPDWHRIRPDKFEHEITISYLELLNASNKCSLFNYQYPTINFSFEKDKAVIKSGGFPSENNANTSIEVISNYEGEICYRLDFFKKALPQLDCEVVKILINTKKNLTQLVDVDDAEKIILLMPFNNQ